MRVFISQASRDAAHNLDDLSERWQLRREGKRYEFVLPEQLPSMQNMNEAKLYKAELFKVLSNLQLEHKRCKRESEADAVQAQINHVSMLQIHLKAIIREMAISEDKSKWVFDTELVKHQKWQARCFGFLVSIGEAELSQTDTETTIRFPKRGIVVSIPTDRLR